MTLNAAEMARMIDHTLLAPDAGPDRIGAAFTAAAELRCAAVCLSPSVLPLDDAATGSLSEAGVVICTVAGFPSGAHSAQVKAFEAAYAVAAGAVEVDMVINLAAAAECRFDIIAAEVAEVRACVPGVLKVILESALWDDVTLEELCRSAVSAGADFVKTSTGFSSAGGASVHAVELMASVVAGQAQVKASGGIRTTADALAMVAVGATRIGSSATESILAGLAG